MPGSLRGAAFGALLLVAVPSAEQRPGSREVQFERDVVSAVDRLFPGFLEVLETDDPELLNDLAETCRPAGDWTEPMSNAPTLRPTILKN